MPSFSVPDKGRYSGVFYAGFSLPERTKKTLDMPDSPQSPPRPKRRRMPLGRQRKPGSPSTRYAPISAIPAPKPQAKNRKRDREIKIIFISHQ